MNVLRDLSLILLAAEAFLFALLPLLIVGGLVYGLWWLRQHQNLPTWLRQIRMTIISGFDYTEAGMEAFAKPVFAVHSFFARLGGSVRALRRGDK